MKPLKVTGRILNPCEGFRKLNPSLFGGPAVGSVDAVEPKQGSTAPLAKKLPGRRGRKGRAILVVTLISCRPGLYDSDNAVSPFKPLRDAIAAELGIDDGDPLVHWETEQCATVGSSGTIVKMELRQV